MDDSESGTGGEAGGDRETRPLSSLQSLYGHVLCQMDTNSPLHTKASTHYVYVSVSECVCAGRGQLQGLVALWMKTEQTLHFADARQ